MKRLVVVPVLLFLISGTLSAQTWDAVVAGNSSFCVPFDPPLLTPGLEWLGDPSENDQPAVERIAAAPNGRIYGLEAPRDILRVTRDAAVSFATLPEGHYGLNLVVDAAGNMYVLAATGGGTRSIDALEPDGTLRATYLLGGTSFDELDLAADQCTLFILSGDVIRRFNVCTGVFLTDFATVFSASDIGILPDGGVLVAAGAELVRLDSSGAETRRYTHPSWTILEALALADGGTTAWVAEEGCAPHTADQINLTSGARIRTHALQMDMPASIVPRNVWTAAIGTGNAPGGATAVPTASVWALITLCALVVLTAIRRVA
jgi:hypothetical protein